jgi:hypothetical protein
MRSPSHHLLLLLLLLVFDSLCCEETMSKPVLLAVAFIASLLATARAETYNGCTTPTLADNKTASADFFSGNTTVGNDLVVLVPCDGVARSFDGCPVGQTGYLATYNGTGASKTCIGVYDERGNTTYDSTSKKFTTTYTSTYISQLDAAPPLTVVIQCTPLVDVLEGSRNGNVITYMSETACPGYDPNVTPAPTQAPPEEGGLSTGAIVGIVIGALAILVIVLVIFRWKAQKGEEEGEYQRV